MTQKREPICLKFRKAKALTEKEKQKLRAEVEAATEVYLKNHKIYYIGYREPEPLNPANVGNGLTNDMQFKQLGFQ